VGIKGTKRGGAVLCEVWCTVSGILKYKRGFLKYKGGANGVR